MPSWKLTIFKNAYKIRLENGDTLEDIDASYPKLTAKEKEEIHNSLDS